MKQIDQYDFKKIVKLVGNFEKDKKQIKIYGEKLSYLNNAYSEIFDTKPNVEKLFKVISKKVQSFKSDKVWIFKQNVNDYSIFPIYLIKNQYLN